MTTINSNKFSVIVSNEGLKSLLKQKKDFYDEKHQALKDTINNIIASGVIDSETKTLLDRAFTEYKDALAGYSNAHERCQSAISENINEVTYTKFEQLNDRFSWVVSGNSYSTMTLTNKVFELITDNINLTADKINLHGYTTVNGAFTIDEKGNMACRNADVHGRVRADLGLFVTEDASCSYGYRFRVYSNGEVYSASQIQVYGIANNSYHSTLTEGRVHVNGTGRGSIWLDGHNADGALVSCTILEADTINAGSLELSGSLEASSLNSNGDVYAKSGSFTSGKDYLYLQSSANSATLGTSSFHSAGSTLGYSSALWGAIYSTSGTINTSDRNYKEDIRYITNDDVSTFNTDSKQAEFTYQDMYDFVKDDLCLATYKYKDIDGERRNINFISQDLLVNEDGSDNVVGQFIIQAEEAYKDGTPLLYSEMNYQGVLAGALKQAISEIEELKNTVAQQQAMIDELIKLAKGGDK